MNAFHLAYLAIILALAICGAICGGSYGYFGALAGGLLGAFVGYLSLLALSRLPRSRMPPCCCGRVNDYVYIMEGDDIVMHCACGRKGMIKGNLLFEYDGRITTQQTLLAKRNVWGQWHNVA